MYAPRRDHDEHGAGARARELWDGARFRKIPLIASMVINFPLAVHDSSPSPSCSLLVVFSPSLSREVASPRTRLASLERDHINRLC